MFTTHNVINARRSGGTQRYHTHARRMVKTQDVAQHAYNVTLLALMLTRGSASRNLLLACLIHDSGEHWVGDVPAPTKRELKIRKDLGKMEEEQLRIMAGIPAPELSPSSGFILKLCDSLEGLLYCLDEYEMGNRQMVGVARNFADYCDELFLGPGFDPIEFGFDAELYMALRELANVMFKENTNV